MDIRERAGRARAIVLAMSNTTLLAPVDREQKLVTHVDRALRGAGNDMLRDSLGAYFGNAMFDRVARSPKLVGPGAWEPGLVYRHDSWVNENTGFGTHLDKTQVTHFRPSNLLSDSALEALFTGDDITQRAITTVPKEILRKGYGIELGDKADRDAESAILDAADELELNKHVMHAMWWGNLFGDGALIIGADDGRPSMLELIPQRVRKIDWLDAYDRRYYAINSYYTSGPKYGKPETYALGNPGAITSPIQIVHESRMIRFGGAPTTTHVRQMRGGYDISKLQAMYEVLRAFATGHKAVEVLLTDGPQGVYKIKNLQSIVAGKNKSLFEQRLQMIDMYRSALRAVVIDSDTENFERQQISFAGISDVLDRLSLRMAAAIPMPASKLMGQAPAGLNATGDNDMRMWADELGTDQTNELAPRLRVFYKILCATKEGPTKGAVPPKISFNFSPLWTLDPKQESERRLATGQTDKLYFDMGAATGEEIALSRFTERGYNADGITIDRDLRQTLIDQDREEALDDTSVPPKDALLPPSNAVVITVDEARAMLNLGPDPDPVVGAMKVAEYQAKLAGATAPGSHPTDPAQNKPNGFPVQEPPDPNAALDENGNPRKNPDSSSPPGPAGAPPQKAT